MIGTDFDATQKTDAELITLTLENRQYFAHIVRRYEAPLLRYIHRMTSVSREEAEDILQEAFIKAYINLRDVDLALSFSSWLYRVVHNQVVSTYRKQQARPDGHAIAIDDDAAVRVVADVDLGGQVDRALVKQKLQQALDTLPEKYREVLVLQFFEQKSYQEMSDILQKPMGSIATLVSRAKQQLKQQLASNQS